MIAIIIILLKHSKTLPMSATKSTNKSPVLYEDVDFEDALVYQWCVPSLKDDLEYTLKSLTELSSLRSLRDNDDYYHIKNCFDCVDSVLSAAGVAKLLLSGKTNAFNLLRKTKKFTSDYKEHYNKSVLERFLKDSCGDKLTLSDLYRLALKYEDPEHYMLYILNLLEITPKEYEDEDGIIPDLFDIPLEMVLKQCDDWSQYEARSLRYYNWWGSESIGTIFRDTVLKTGKAEYEQHMKQVEDIDKQIEELMKKKQQIMGK
jgi:hypothetical protein